MDIQYYGGNCIRIANKKATIVIDDTLEALGQKSITKKDDIAVFTSVQEREPADVKLCIDTPGEYEVSEIMITGVQVRAHMDEADKCSATMYKILIDDIRIAVLGHVHPDLSESQLERLGVIDVLFVPVGGSGYTLDSLGALKLIKKIEPKVIIPTHYDDKALKYEVPQQTLTDALHGMSMEPAETVDKLKLKDSEIGEAMRLIVLNRS